MMSFTQEFPCGVWGELKEEATYSNEWFGNYDLFPNKIMVISSGLMHAQCCPASHST